MAGVLEGKVALITGSGRGQGLAAARLFAAEGCSIVVNDLDADTTNAAVADIAGRQGRAVAAVGDVADSASVQRMLEIARIEFGGVDILYNNAGIGFSATARMDVEMTDLVSCTEDDWTRIMAINVSGVFLVCKYGIPMLIERGGGSIINTASIAAMTGGPSAHAYTASKGAVVSLTRSIAKTPGPEGHSRQLDLPRRDRHGHDPRHDACARRHSRCPLEGHPDRTHRYRGRHRQYRAVPCQ